MSDFTVSKTTPAVAMSALAAALLVVFPSAHAEPVSHNVVASGWEHKTLQSHKSYNSLEAKRGGKISGKNVSVKGRAGNLVNANSGGEINLQNADIEASRAQHGHNTQQGPAVSATGDSGRGRHGHDSVVTLEGGKVTTHNSNSPALRASQRGGEIHADGTKLHTYGSQSDVVQALDGGKVTLRRTEITSEGKRSDGIEVSGRGSSVTVDRSRISTRGESSDGVSVGSGGVAFIEKSGIQTNGRSADGVDVSGRGSFAVVDTSRISTHGEDSDGVNVDNGGAALIGKSSIQTSGRSADGVKVSGWGSSVAVDRSYISTRGENSDGVSVNNGGVASIEKSSIQTNGRSADGVVVSGKHSRVVADSIHVSTKGDNSTGLKVEDDGSLWLSHGDVESKGRDGKGIAVDDRGRALVVGSNVSVSGERGIALDVDGRGSHAVVLGSSLQSSGRNGQAVLIENGGDAIVAGSTITAKGLGVGVQGEDSAFVGIGVDVAVESSGRDRHHQNPATGILVEDKGKALLVGGSVQASGRGATGVAVSGSGSLVSAFGTEIDAAGSDSAGMRISKGANAILVNSQVQGSDEGIDVSRGAHLGVIGGSVAATGSHGVAVSISGNDSAAVMMGTDLTAGGRDGVAVDVRGAGQAYLKDSSLNARGVGLQADGRGTSVVSVGSTIVAGSDSEPNVRRFHSDPSVGVAASNGAKVALIGGSVEALGDGSVGARAAGARILADGVDISASGTNATAVLAQQAETSHGHGRDRHALSSQIAVIGSTVSTTGAGAVAVKANGKRSAVFVDDSTVTTAGQGSYGVVSEDGGKVVLNNSTVNVSGEGTAAARVQSDTSWHNREVSGLYVNGSDLTAAGENSAGIELQNSGNVYLKDSTVSATGASLASKLDRGYQTQNIVVGSGATLVDNNGTLLQVNRSGDSGSSRVNLDLQDGSVTAGNIIDDLGSALSGNGGTYVNLGALASYDGKMIGVRDVATNGGNQKIHFEGGSSIGSLSIDGKAVTSGGTIDQRIIATGDVTVDDATLGGNWAIGGKLTSKNGGIIKPGNSVGIISTNSIDWQPGSIYQAEINEAGKSDLLEVTGSGVANIANTSLVVSEENGQGRFRLNHDYTILTAVGGVDGEFASANWTGTAYPLIAMDTLYSNNAVAVRMGVNRQALNTMGFTPNQRSAGFGAASVAGANATADEAFFSSDPARAFDQLSGEVHATARSLVFSDMLSTNAALQSQMRANLGARMQPGDLTVADDGTPSTTKPKSSAYPVWVRLNAAGIDLDGDGNTASAHYTTTRLLVGGDVGIAGGWRLGAAGGISSGDFTIKNRSSDGTLGNYTFALYGGNSWKLGMGKLNLLLGGGYTRNDVETNRNVTLGASQKLSASYHGSTWQLFGDLGYAIPWGEANNVEPYVNISWFDQRMNGFNESGGDAALGSSASTASLSSYTLGLRSALTFPNKAKALTIRTDLGWRHAGGDRSPTRSMSFIEGAGGVFSIAGAPIAKDSFLAGLSGEVTLGKYLVMGLSYHGEYGSGYADNAGSLYMKMRF